MHSSPATVLIRKLKRLKARLSDWNQDVFRNIYAELDEASLALDDIQQEIAQHGDFDVRFDLEMNSTSRVNNLLARRHAYLTQRNWLQWLKDGDINSTFFHRLHITTTLRGSIKIVQVGDFLYNVEVEIGDQIVTYYERLHTADNILSRDYSVLDGFVWGTVSHDQNLLVATLSDEEIKEVFFGLSADSTPEPDSFGVTFTIHVEISSLLTLYRLSLFYSVRL